MKILRYRRRKDAPARWGWLSGDGIERLEGSPFSTYRRKEPRLRLSSVELLPPVQPSKIVCIGRNYASHAEEHGAEVPALPLIFLKPPSALIADGKPILLPPQSRQVEHEAELAVVIGARARLVSLLAQIGGERLPAIRAGLDISGNLLKNRSVHAYP